MATLPDPTLHLARVNSRSRRVPRRQRPHPASASSQVRIRVLNLSARRLVALPPAHRGHERAHKGGKVRSTFRFGDFRASSPDSSVRVHDGLAQATRRLARPSSLHGSELREDAELVRSRATRVPAEDRRVHHERGDQLGPARSHADRRLVDRVEFAKIPNLKVGIGRRCSGRQQEPARSVELHANIWAGTSTDLRGSGLLHGFRECQTMPRNRQFFPSIARRWTPPPRPWQGRHRPLGVHHALKNGVLYRTVYGNGVAIAEVLEPFFERYFAHARDADVSPKWAKEEGAPCQDGTIVEPAG